MTYCYMASTVCTRRLPLMKTVVCCMAVLYQSFAIVLYQSFAVDEDRGLLRGSYCISRLPLMKTVVCCVARTVSVVCR